MCVWSFVLSRVTLASSPCKTLTVSPQLPGLNAYKGYCSNQLAAKALLDQKKQDRRVQDFLQRCLESPFSRKLDLWSFLDIPRSRLVKYPLLLREILRHTPSDHPDGASLEKAVGDPSRNTFCTFEFCFAIVCDAGFKNGPFGYADCNHPGGSV